MELFFSQYFAIFDLPLKVLCHPWLVFTSKLLFLHKNSTVFEFLWIFINFSIFALTFEEKNNNNTEQQQLTDKTTWPKSAI